MVLLLQVPISRSVCDYAMKRNRAGYGTYALCENNQSHAANDRCSCSQPHSLLP